MAGLLDGKSALITGGGGGIGRATALAFAREGARVAVADAAEAAAQETVALINKAGGQAMTLTGDVTERGGGGDGQGGGYRLWPAGLRVQQCRYRRVPGGCGGQEDRRLVGGIIRPDDRGQPEGRVAVHEARADRRWWRRVAARSSTPPRSPD